MPNDEKFKSLLSDLGRATLRGVRKCHKCGTYNGTRGLSCKNKSCDVVFKEAGEKRKMSTEACKLITGSTTQVFSVRVRDKGPDYRGFVQLPVNQANLEEHSLDNEASIISQTTALCFVDTCQRSFDASILKCHEKTGPLITTCQHIQAAFRCYAEAQPLVVKNSVLSALNVGTDMKQQIWLLATETTGPLVQRVSKNIMAVKCKATPKHPLGYLHFSFFMSRVKDRIENRYFCSCSSFKGQVKHATSKEDANFKRCAHFYACICAFISDPKLSEEFAYYISLDHHQIQSGSVGMPITIDPMALGSEEHQTLVAYLREEGGGTCEVEVEVLRDEAALLEATGLTVSEDGTIHGLDVLSEPLELQIQDLESARLCLKSNADNVIPHDTQPPFELLSVKRKRNNEKSHISLNLTPQESNINSIRKEKQVRKGISAFNKKQDPADENTVNFSFLQWLASVTERINQTMHFQFDGKPDALVFHVPQLFFDCLRERISVGGKKKRLPNTMSAFIRKDAIPLGTFTKYTWNITNIIHVKQIFETPLMSLDICRSFVENRDGTYEPYNQGKDETDLYRKTESSPFIKPLELKTFLKVGNTVPDQKEPTPFLIEWIPDILPRTKIGELRIRFEFGHQRNGLVEKRPVEATHRTLPRLEPSSDISITRLPVQNLDPLEPNVIHLM